MTDLGAQHTAVAVACTMPIPGATSCATAHELLAYLARVSNTANQDNHLTGPALIRALVKRREWSPLDQIDLTYEVNTSRRVSRQIIRHWTLKPQEFSQRWAEVPPRPCYTQGRVRVAKDRGLTEPASSTLNADYMQRQAEAWARAYEDYTWAIAQGLHPECAAVFLPEGMAPTRCYFKGSLRTWLHYSLLRTGRRTQEEHRMIAFQVWDDLTTRFPELGAGAEGQTP